jgi:hypothetical protein
VHERSQKNNPRDTILYEFDMLRHCAGTLSAKKAIADHSGSDRDGAEYYLGIEGFLLHFRNILAFFTNKRLTNTDLTLDRPEQWAERAVDPHEYGDLTVRSKQLNDKYGVTVNEKKSDCYDQISKYLQHCTVLRHERSKKWNIESMFADILPILDDFETRFVARTRRVEFVLGRVDNSTATFRASRMLSFFSAGFWRRRL